MEKELLDKIRDAYESESPKLGSLLKEAGFSENELNQLRAAYESMDDKTFGSIVTKGPVGRAKSERQRLGMKREEYGQYVAEQEGATPEAQAQREREIWKQENPIISKIVPSYDPVAGEQAISQSADPRKMDEATIDDLTAGFEGLQKSFIAPVKDIVTVPQRVGLAAGTGAIAKGAEIYTGGDLPIGDIMSESFGRTGAREDMGLAEATAEDILRDPLLFAPSPKGSNVLGKMGFEAGLEGVSQALDPNKQSDVSSIAVGAGVPLIGGFLKGGGKMAAKRRFGEEGDKLLDEGLVPFTGSPEGKIAKELDVLKAERNIDIRPQDQEAGELMGRRIEAAREQGLDIAEDEYEDLIKPFRGFDEKAYETVNTLTGTVDVLRSQAKPIKKEIAEYGKDLEAVYSKETLIKFVNQLKVDAKGGNTPKAKAAQVMINEIEPTLKQFDPVKPRAERIQTLEGLQGTVQDSPVYTELEGVLSSRPVMLGSHTVGGALERGSGWKQGFGLSPEAAKALYGQIMANNK